MHRDFARRWPIFRKNGQVLKLGTSPFFGFIEHPTNTPHWARYSLPYSGRGVTAFYTVNQKKRGSLFLSITLANLN